MQPSTTDQQHAPASNTVIVATAGHVDHGKSALVRSLTGTDTDTLAEEKKRGLSINLGYAYLHHSGTDGQPLTVGFVDVPGHTDFINNMLAGVGAVDSALLIVAADDGIMPQTREHLAILKLLQLRRGALVITKTDRVSLTRLQILDSELDQLLTDSVFAPGPRFRVSNATGEGVEDLRHYLHSLAGAANEAASTAVTDSPPRFLVDRAFTVKGLGTVVTGSLRAGQLLLDQVLANTATGETLRIRSIRQDSQQLGRATSGQRLALNVTCSLNQIGRGDWLLEPEFVNPVRRLDVRLELLEPGTSIKPSAHYHLFHGATHGIVSLRQLQDGLPYYQMLSNKPLHGFYGDRFILRDPAAEKTLGGGTILDSFVPRRGRASETRLAELLAMTDEPAACLAALSAANEHGVDLEKFRRNRLLTRDRIEQLLASPLLAQNATRLRLDKPLFDRLLSSRHYATLEQTIIDSVRRFHSQHADQQGLSLPQLSDQTRFSGSAILLQAVVAKLLNSKVLGQSGTLVHLPEHQTQLSAEQEKFLNSVRPHLIKGRWVTPRTRELVELTGIPLRPLLRILETSRKQGSLVRVAENRYYLPEVIAEIAEFTEELAAQEDEGFSVIQFRDGSNIGRNLCIEILEYFDSIGFTRRDGNSRFLRTSKDNLFRSS